MALRTRARARCSNTRWFPSVRSSASQTSGEVQCCRSLSSNTACCPGGRLSTARSMTANVSVANSRSSGARPSSSAATTSSRVGASETDRVDDGLSVGVALGLGGQGDLPPLRQPRRLRLVDQDPEDPGPQGGPPLEGVDAPHDAQPGLLHRLLGDGSGASVKHRQAQHRRCVLIDERREDALVAATERVEKRTVRPSRSCGALCLDGVVVSHGRRADDGGTSRVTDCTQTYTVGHVARRCSRRRLRASRAQHGRPPCRPR